MTRAIRIGVSHVVWLGAVVGGTLLSGEPPRLLVYTFLFKAFFRLLAFGLLDAAWRPCSPGS